MVKGSQLHVIISTNSLKSQKTKVLKRTITVSLVFFTASYNEASVSDCIQVEYWQLIFAAVVSDIHSRILLKADTSFENHDSDGY